MSETYFIVKINENKTYTINETKERPKNERRLAKQNLENIKKILLENLTPSGNEQPNLIDKARQIEISFRKKYKSKNLIIQYFRRDLKNEVKLINEYIQNSHSTLTGNVPDQNKKIGKALDSLVKQKILSKEILKYENHGRLTFHKKIDAEKTLSELPSEKLVELLTNEKFYQTTNYRYILSRINQSLSRINQSQFTKEQSAEICNQIYTFGQKYGSNEAIALGCSLGATPQEPLSPDEDSEPPPPEANADVGAFDSKEKVPFFSSSPKEASDAKIETNAPPPKNDLPPFHIIFETLVEKKKELANLEGKRKAYHLQGMPLPLDFGMKIEKAEQEKLTAELQYSRLLARSNLEKLVKFNTKEFSNEITSTLLGFALALDEVEEAQVLIAHGAKWIDGQTGGTHTPLEIAIRMNYDVKTLEKLLGPEPGRIINAKDHQGNTALHHAVLAAIASKPESQLKKMKIIEYLISKGANLNALNAESKTPLDLVYDDQAATRRKMGATGKDEENNDPALRRDSEIINKLGEGAEKGEIVIKVDENQ